MSALHAPKVAALLAYDAGLLSARGTRRVETHLGVCDACKRTLAAIRAYDGLVEDTRSMPKDAPLLVHCAGGYRSSIAASLLQREGFTNVMELAGGLAAWESSGNPLTKA